MNPQSFAKSPGHFLSNQSTRILCWWASLGFLLACPFAHAGTTWDGGGGNTNINTAANWDSDTLPISLTDGTQTLTFGTGGSISTINTNVNALGLLINRDAAFTIQNGDGNLTIGTGGITVNPGSTTARSHLISENNLILAGNQTWAVTNTGIGSGNMQLTVSGNISGNFGIIKTGTGGILQLSGSNSFTGGVIVRDGFFNLANTAAPGSGVLTLGDNTVSASTTSLTLNFDTTSGTYASDITFVRNGQSQTKTIQSRVSNATLNGTITLAQDARFNASAGNTLTINGKITGSTGTVVTLLSNTGTVVLANANNDFNSGVSSNLFTERGTLLLRGNDSAGVGGAAGVLGAGTGGLSIGSNNANGDNAQVLIDGAFTIARAINMNQGVAASSTNTLGGNTSDTSTFSGNIALASGSNTSFRLTAATNGTVNFTGAISGTASNGLSKIGNGRAVLSGNNTYTGATTISAGTLQFAKAASLYNGTAASWTKSNITVNSGATLALNVGGTGEFTTGNVTTILGLATSINNNGLRGGSQIAFDTTNAAGGTFIINDNIVNSSGTGNGTLGLVKLGANTLTLNGTNTYTGNTTVSAGVLSISSTSALPSWSTNGSYSVASGASLAVYNAVTDANIATMLGTTNFAAGSAIGFDTTTADRTYSATLGNTAQGALGLTKVGSNALILTANNTYTGNTTISGGTLQVGAGSTAGALGSGAVVNNGALVFNRSDNITMANNISGTGSLTQNASSILTLNGTNTYSGLTNISGNGVIDVGTISNNAIPSGSGILLGSSTAASGIYGILQGNGNLTRSLSGSATPGSGQISGAAGGFAARGGQLTITFGNNASTELALNQGAYAFGNNFVFGSSTADSKVLLQNNINLNSGSPRNITVNAGVGGDAATSVEFSGVIRNLASTGIAQINKNGDGMLILSNASNSFNGSVSINNGTISVNRINSVGGGNSVLGAAATATEGTIALGSTTSTGRLLYTGSGDTTDRVINLLGTTGGGIIDQSGLGTLKFTSNFTATGGGSKTLTLQGSTAGIGEISGAVVNNSAANTTSLTKNGTGSWVLSGVNTYTGATTINAGTLSIAAITNGTVAGALGNSTSAAGNLVLRGGTLEYTGSANGATDRNFTLTAGTISGISVTNSTVSLTISGNAAATTGALTKSGAGTLILSGNNSYSGDTTINTGTLALGGSGSLGGGAYSGNIANSGTFTLNTTAAQTLSGIISGNGALTKSNTGTLTLSGNNAYTGNTTISGGTLLLSGTGTLGTSTISIAGGTLDMGAKSLTNTFGSLTGGTLSNGTLTNNGSNYDLQNGTVSAVLAGTNGVNKTTSSTLTLSGANTYNGATTITAGTLTISNNTALGGTVGGTTIASGASLNLQGDITVAEALTHNGGTSGFLRNVSGNNTVNGDIIVGAGNSRIESAAGLLTIGGNITMTSGPIFQGAGNISITGVVSGSNNFTMGGLMSGVLTLSGNNTYTGGTLVNSGTLSVSSINNQSTNGVFGNSTGQIYLGSATANGTLQYTGAGVTTNRQIRVGGAAGTTDTGSAIIRNDGSGALVFSIATFNQASANTTANRTLTLGGTNTALNTIQGAIVDNTASTGLVSLTKADAGTWVLSGANTYSGATTINAGTLQIGAGGASGSLSTSSIITNNGTLAFNRSGNMTQGTNFANSISGTGNLTQAGSGTLFLGGTNSYTGLTTISAGNLSINATTAVGSTSGINLANATALLYTGGAASLGANITVTGGTGTIRNTGGALTLYGDLSKNGTTLTLAGGSNGITVSGAISGSANNSDLVIDGGTTTLTNANNSYNGPTFIINSGTLNANTAGALPTSTLTAVTINGSSTLALGASQSIASLSGTSGSTVNLNANTLTINGSATTTYSGGISGTGNLVKNGSGTQTLAAANTYTGTTTVNSGTLKADAAGAMGNSTVINVTGGSFLVTAENAVNDNAAINLGGGTLAVSGTFNENVGLLTLSADSIIDLNGFSGILRFGGVGSWAPSANLAIWNWNGINEYGTPVGDGVANRKIVFADNTGLSNYLDRISFYSGSNNSGFAGNAFQQSFSQSGFEGHQIIAVPEPETYITAVALLLGVTFYQIRLARHGQGLLARLTFLRRRAKRKPLGGSSSRMTQISSTEGL